MTSRPDAVTTFTHRFLVDRWRRLRHRPERGPRVPGADGCTAHGAGTQPICCNDLGQATGLAWRTWRQADHALPGRRGIYPTRQDHASCETRMSVSTMSLHVSTSLIHARVLRLCTTSRSAKRRLLIRLSRAFAMEPASACNPACILFIEAWNGAFLTMVGAETAGVALTLLANHAAATCAQRDRAEIEPPHRHALRRTGVWLFDAWGRACLPENPVDRQAPGISRICTGHDLGSTRGHADQDITARLGQHVLCHAAQ